MELKKTKSQIQIKEEKMRMMMIHLIPMKSQKVLEVEDFLQILLKTLKRIPMIQAIVLKKKKKKKKTIIIIRNGIIIHILQMRQEKRVLTMMEIKIKIKAKIITIFNIVIKIMLKTILNYISIIKN